MNDFEQPSVKTRLSPRSFPQTAHHLRWTMLCTVFLVTGLGCDGDEAGPQLAADAMVTPDTMPPALDAAPDATPMSPEMGAPIDAGSDSAVDATRDARPDANRDATSTSPDAASDAAPDGAPPVLDATPDALPTPPDAATDAALEMDATPDAAPPVPDAAPPIPDAAPDAIPDAANPCETFDDTFQPLLDEQCVQCHGGAAPSVQLDLSRGQSIAALTNRASVWGNDLVLVTPGNPGASFLIEKLRANPRHGLTMPPGAPSWSDDMIWHLANWIAEAAPGQEFNCDGPVLPAPGQDQGVPPDLDAGIEVDAAVVADAIVDADQNAICTTFDEAIQPLFDEDCVQCHTPDNLLAGLDLSAGAARNSLVGQSSQWDVDLVLVDPGQPHTSFLVEKLLANPRHGDRMPLVDAPWEAAKVDAVINWIAWGASDDAYCGQAEIPEPPDAAPPLEDAGEAIDLDAGVDEEPGELQCSNFADDIQPLIERTCRGCHIDIALGGLDLTGEVVLDNLIDIASSADPNLTLIVPGDVDQSYFVDKMLPNPTNGSRMPLGAPNWTPAQMLMLTDWIEAGAPRGDYDCEDAPPPDPEAEECVTFDEVIQPMLNAGCVRCHSTENPLGELDLSEGNAIGELVRADSIWDPELQLVSPRDPASSFLIEKLRANPSHGNQMPWNAAPWTDAEIDEVIAWINAGAHARDYGCEDAFVPPEEDAAPPPEDLDAAVEDPEACRTFDDTIQPLLEQGCTGCHSPNGGNQGQLDLSAGSAMDNLIDVASAGNPNTSLVVSGDSAASYFMEKLRPNPTVGDRMPPFGAAWNAGRMALLAQWIDAGAPRGEYACGEVEDEDAAVDAAPEAEEDAAPPEELDPPVPIVASDQQRPDIDVVQYSADAHRYGAAALNTVLVQSVAGVRHLGEGDPIAVPGIMGDIQRVEVINNEIVMVLTDQNLYAVNGRFGRLSPLGDALDGPALDLVDASENGEAILWITTADTLYRWAGGALEAVDLPDVVVGNPQLSFGAIFEGQRALWLTSDDLLLAIVTEDDALTAWIIQEDVTFDLIASDIQGAFWGTIGRELYRRSAAGRWVNYVHDNVITGLSGHRDAQMLWFTAPGGSWGHLNGEFWPFPEIAADSELAAAARDVLITAGPTGVNAVTPTDLPPVVRDVITWEQHIEPLALAQCDLCHGRGRNAHPLFAAEQWVAEFDEILHAVRNGQMPLNAPPLSAREVQAIEDWAAGGFLANEGD